MPAPPPPRRAERRLRSALRFVDLHCHVLPGVDDGPASLEEAVETLRTAWRGGTRAVTATSHAFAPLFPGGEAEPMRTAFRAFKAALEMLVERGGFDFLAELEVYPGAENYLSAEFLAALDGGRVLTLNDSRYLLLEFPPFLTYDTARAGAERVLAAGRVPLLAHVERYPFLHGAEGRERLRRLRELGCAVQVNGESCLGVQGRRLAREADRLLRDRLVDVVASDGHGPERRSPDLAEVGRRLGRRHGERPSRVWLWDNPRRVVADEPLPPAG